MTKIYTKNGDKGMTGTLKGRVSKGDCQTEALGVIDELNSWIGVCRVQTTDVDEELRRIQNNLLTLGSGLAGSDLRIGNYELRRLEKLIDRLTKDLPKLNNFIFPTGSGGAEYLQVARVVARRCEREVVRAMYEDKIVLKYLNRLSDALFTMARWVNWKAGGKEEVWNPTLLKARRIKD